MNNDLCRSCILKINNSFINNAEYLHIVIPMYNMLEYSDDYSVTLGNLWNYCRDELNDDKNQINANNYIIDSSKSETSESFEYKTKIIGSTAADNNILATKVVVPLNCLSNFGRPLDLPLIECDLDLDFSMVKIFHNI